MCSRLGIYYWVKIINTLLILFYLYWNGMERKHWHTSFFIIVKLGANEIYIFFLFGTSASIILSTRLIIRVLKINKWE